MLYIHEKLEKKEKRSRWFRQQRFSCNVWWECETKR